MKFELEFVVKAVGGDLQSDPIKSFSAISTDNRDKNISQTLFVPLVGDNHDAHKFVRAAVEAGAGGVLYHQWMDDWDDLKVECSFIKVDDTLKALQSLAHAWRQQLSGKVLALTGSNGKTTTKDFLSQLIMPFSSCTVSHGSFNNHWGLPLTLLSAEKDHQYVVTEMGMNHAGEITELMKIAEPDYVMVTNVGRAHVGNFSNGIDGVAAAKEEIYQSAKKEAHFVFNIDNPWTQKMYEKYHNHPNFTFSTHNFSADVYFKIKNKTPQGFEVEGQIGGVLGKTQLKFWGEHNLENLAAAVAMAYKAGVLPEKLWGQLGNCHTGWGRNQWLQLESGGSVLFDAYNANPDSFQQLLRNIQPLFNQTSQLVAIFGEMRELGAESAREHQQLGREAGQLPWSHCLFIGPSSAAFLQGWQESGSEIKPMIFNTYKETLDLDLSTMLDRNTQFIVKGSRGGALERIVQRLQPVDFPPK